jgi:cell division control protein 6
VTPKVSLDEIIASNNRLFKNKQVLKPNYTLKGIDDILHRDAEIRTFYEYMKDIFSGVSPSNVFIYGKPGLGKTLLTKLASEEIKIEAEVRFIELCIININCDEIKTEHAILQRLVQEIPSDEPRRVIGNSTSKHNEYLKYLIDHYQGIIIIILDELDKAANPEMINKIIRTESALSGQFPTIIGITNNTGLRDRFPPHLKSVLCENDLIINPYDAMQLQDIIRARVEIAFKPGVVEEDVIGLCAAFAAQDYGDVRRAIDLLRVSGEIAESNNKSRVTEKDVREACEKIEVDRAIEVIKTLPTQSKAALLSCIYVFDSQKENTTANIYEVYRKLAHELGIDQLTQRRVTDLLSELSQLGIIDGFNDFRGRQGRKKVITKITSKNTALETIYRDYIFSEISEVPPSTFLRT